MTFQSGFLLLLATALASPSTAQGLSFEGAQPDPAAVRIMDIYARCAVDRDPKRAAEIIETDYHTTAYRSAIRAFALKEKGCVPRAGKLKFQPIVFAGNIAEELLRKRGVDVALLNISVLPASYDGLAACVLKAGPIQVAELLGTTPASTNESRAVDHLQKVVADCLPSGQAPVTNKVVFRAMLALASYKYSNQTS